MRLLTMKNRHLKQPHLSRRSLWNKIAHFQAHSWYINNDISKRSSMSNSHIVLLPSQSPTDIPLHCSWKFTFNVLAVMGTPLPDIYRLIFQLDNLLFNFYWILSPQCSSQSQNSLFYDDEVKLDERAEEFVKSMEESTSWRRTHSFIRKEIQFKSQWTLSRS